jgi:Mg2+ and Co2+ transporter CorA
VPLEVALRETDAVAARLESGRLHPTSPFSLTYAIVSALARREAELVAEIAREVGLLEQRVMAEEEGDDPQAFLSELFAARHELLTIKTMAEQGSEIYRRAIKLTTFYDQHSGGDQLLDDRPSCGLYCSPTHEADATEQPRRRVATRSIGVGARR